IDKINNRWYVFSMNKEWGYLRGKAKGDQYFIVRIEIPKDISEEQKKLLIKFHELNKKKK
ncbi:MAG: hypothetical protein ACFFC1_16165, partial [Promethearchaeota archaeon]